MLGATDSAASSQLRSLLIAEQACLGSPPRPTAPARLFFDLMSQLTFTPVTRELAANLARLLRSYASNPEFTPLNSYR